MIQPCILDPISGHHDGSEGNEGPAETEGSRSAGGWHPQEADLPHKGRGCLPVPSECQGEGSPGLGGGGPWSEAHSGILKRPGAEGTCLGEYQVNKPSISPISALWHDKM